MAPTGPGKGRPILNPLARRKKPLGEALSGASELVFLCTGNMVRSAFAELYARTLGCPVPVRSAATQFRNEGLFPETAAALKEFGVPRRTVRDFRPTFLGDVLADLDARAVVFGMTRTHLEALGPRPALRRRGYLLLEALGRDGEIADPVLEGADFRRTFELVAGCVEALVRHPALEEAPR